jgi:hypothetical protein
LGDGSGALVAAETTEEQHRESIVSRIGEARSALEALGSYGIDAPYLLHRPSSAASLESDRAHGRLEQGVRLDDVRDQSPLLRFCGLKSRGT